MTSVALLVGVSLETFAQLPIGDETGGSVTTLDDVEPADRLIEDDHCADVALPGRAAAPSVSPGSDGDQAIVVRVRPTAIIDLVEGQVVSALTNTGCAPRPTDDLFVRDADGTIVELDGWQVVELDGWHLDDVDWTGDFSTPGESVPQRRGR